jgi:hypothetical protein
MTLALRPRQKAVDPLQLAPAGAEAKAERAIRRMLAEAVASVSLAQLEGMVEHRGEIATLRFPLIDPAPLEAILLRTVQAAGVREAAAIEVVKAKPEPAASISASFNLADPAAAAWAQQRAGELVVEISEGTRDSIRALIQRAVIEGGHPTVIARDIKPLIGLHSRWSTAVLNYRYSLEANGMSASRVGELSARYYDKLLTTRSRTIARTEILKSANEGKAQGWAQAQAQGLLPQNATKVWVAAGDAEAICADLDGTEVGLGEDFSSELGDVSMPPLHPNCRCTCSIGRGQ